MEVNLSTEASSLSYPHRKVVVVADHAEVAELPGESETSENLFFHEDLVSRLRERYPELGRDTEFTAGWLSESGDEAVLHLWVGAGGFSAADVERIGRAMTDWCDASGVRRLTIADASSRRGSSGPSASNWGLPEDPSATPVTAVQSNFAYALPRLMGLHNRSGAKLAGYLGVSTQYVSMLLKGARRPTEERLAEIAAIFGIDPGRLVKAPFEELLQAELADPVRYRETEERIAILERGRQRTKAS